MRAMSFWGSVPIFTFRILKPFLASSSACLWVSSPSRMEMVTDVSTDFRYPPRSL